ncbi:MAG: 4-vinyl reductase [Candidatus Ozemobacteraceae bacterium]
MQLSSPDKSRRYAFSWELLGDLEKGRPNLGKNARLEVYRLMQFCFRDIIERKFGTDSTDEIFRDSGFLAGCEFYKHIIGETKDLSDFVKKLQEACRELSIGIVRIEEADLANGRIVMTVSEDLDCSGLPDINHVVCTYDEGFIAAMLESFTGKPFDVREIDCWCTGDRTCRFECKIKTIEKA